MLESVETQRDPMKKILFTHKSDQAHWVGDGFPVRSMFTYNDLGQQLSPFLLLDYAGPVEFSPSEHIRGVGGHPHRGFETVTIVYSGEVEHRDSSGGGGKIGPGEVQWMTAASGLVHEEFHGKDYAKRGGPFEMVQLWVNLPKKDKMNRPRYQGITKDLIPEVSLTNNSGIVRVIAGKYLENEGPALTHTPINLWDIRLNSGHEHEFLVPSGHTALLMVLSGELEVNHEKTIRDAEIVVFDRDQASFHLNAKKDCKLLFMGGEPINEPIVGYGPFVMNSQDEIRQAFSDFQNGKMGDL